MPVPPAFGDMTLLLRVLALIGTGVRRPRGLAEVLDVDAARVEAALATAEWLALVHREGDAMLTPAGLSCALAGSARARAYAAALATHPAVHDIGQAPHGSEIDALTSHLHRHHPQAADLPRRARTLWRVLRPALRAPRRPHTPAQLGLDFTASPLPPRPGLDLSAGTEDSPFVYALVLRTLLDHGELSPAQLRAVLDDHGGATCGIGGYLAMAVRRGDATRAGDILVVTRGAVQRRTLAESAVTVALSDPELRAWLVRRLAGAPAGGRYEPVLRRLTPGASAEPTTLKRALDRLLFGRGLDSVPLAGDPGALLPIVAEPFLEAATRRGLSVAFPSDLALLGGGLAAINRMLRQTANEAAAVRLPSPADRRVAIHGGLLHPREAPPRIIPDLWSLRLRAVRMAPALALLAALGVLDRRGRFRLRLRDGNVWLDTRGGRPQPVTTLIDRVAASRDWVLVTPPGPGDWAAQAAVAEQLGLMATVGDRLTLDEPFFYRLQTDAEHRDAWEGLQPLVELLDGLLPRAET